MLVEALFFPQGDYLRVEGVYRHSKSKKPTRCRSRAGGISISFAKAAGFPPARVRQCVGILYS